MDWQTVENNWKAFVPVLIRRWPELDEDELLSMTGRRKRFTSYLAKRHELTLLEAEEEVGYWLDSRIPLDVITNPLHDNASITESAAHIPEGEDVYSEDADFGDDRIADRPLGRSAG